MALGEACAETALLDHRGMSCRQDSTLHHAQTYKILFSCLLSQATYVFVGKYGHGVETKSLFFAWNSKQESPKYDLRVCFQ